jgi:hypothetical protein
VSTDPAAAGSGAGPSRGGEPGAGGPDAQPSEAELRAAYEAELARITSTDLMLQAAVSLLNVGSYRLMPPQTAGADPAAAAAAGAAGAASAGGDLEQVRDAIDGVRALLEILERRVPSELRPLRDALSQLQMAYAREVQAQGGGSGEPRAGSEPGAGGLGGAESPSQPASPGPGPAESSGRLWVPGR